MVVNILRSDIGGVNDDIPDRAWPPRFTFHAVERHLFTIEQIGNIAHGFTIGIQLVYALDDSSLLFVDD